MDLSGIHGSSRTWKKTGLKFPGFLQEYFYRRVLEAIGYFEDGPHQGLDPYLYQKEKGLLSSWKSVEELCTQVKTWEIEKIPLPLQISRMLLLDVWGNRSDMSIWSADDQTQALGKVQNGQDGLLLNELEEFTTFLHQAGDRLGRVDILVDNAGFELFCDLLLVDILLKNEIASSIHLHLKPYPVFVSDAMKKDVLYTVGQITGSIQSDVHNMGLRLDEWLDGERIVLEDDRFWISPFPAWEMPDDLVATLANSDLLISKGDANYRRLLGDCHWDLTLPFSQIVSYLPSPLLALRVCKSEIVAGLSDEQIRYLNQNQPGWMTCGDFAVINFAQSQSG